VTRPTFFEPEGGLRPQTVHDMLSMVISPPPLAELERFAPLELLVAYDWAVREHMRASDNLVRRRPMPRILVLAKAAARG